MVHTQTEKVLRHPVDSRRVSLTFQTENEHLQITRDNENLAGSKRNFFSYL